MPNKERALILCREWNSNSERLLRTLSPYLSVEIITDNPCSMGTYYTDEESAGFARLSTRYGTRITAWERAFVHLDKTHGPIDSPIWLIEDDVGISNKHIERFISETQKINADLSTSGVRQFHEHVRWNHWGKIHELFIYPTHSFNPFCRISSRLLACILEFRRSHGHFIFHEILFATLCAEHGFSYFDWRTCEEMKHYFKAFRFRPSVKQEELRGSGIYHPVKDAAIHAAICNLENV